MTQTESVGGVQDKSAEVSDRGKNSGLNGVDGRTWKKCCFSNTHTCTLGVIEISCGMFGT